MVFGVDGVALHPTSSFRLAGLSLLSCAALVGCSAPETGAAHGHPLPPSTEEMPSSTGTTVDNPTDATNSPDATIPSDTADGTDVHLSPSNISTVSVGPRIRRLTNAEYRATVSSALGLNVDSVEFVPESRQAGYTRNEASIVDPILARQLEQEARVIAAALPESSFYKGVPCTVAAADEACGARAKAKRTVKTGKLVSTCAGGKGVARAPRTHHCAVRASRSARGQASATPTNTREAHLLPRGTQRMEGCPTPNTPTSRVGRRSRTQLSNGNPNWPSGAWCGLGGGCGA